jgi:hypothetical protein
MTDEELEAIEQRLKAITPGNWRSFLTEDGRARIKSDASPFIVAECSVRDPNDPEQTANAEFIASAKDTIERLLAEVQRYRERYDPSNHDSRWN